MVLVEPRPEPGPSGGGGPDVGRSDGRLSIPVVAVKIWRHDVDLEAVGRLDAVDLTDDLSRAVKDSGITEGFVLAHCPHTTATLLLNEWEEGALDDLRRRIEELVPGGVYYAHDDLERRTRNLQEGHERANGRSHVAQMLLGGASHAIPVEAGEPVLGRWQRLLFLELDEPRERRITFRVFGEVGQNLRT
jgi:secondary thiamine-phosphate synthase enzyme